MTRRLLAGCLFLLAVSCARAQDAPERLLSAQTHFYLRWDGTASHQAADQSALGQILQGDTGKLISTYLTEVKANHLLKLLRSLAAHGLVVGVEVLKVEANSPPEWQLTAVLPNARLQWDPLFGSTTWAADMIGIDVKEIEVMKRTVYHLRGAQPCVAFWKEGDDAVLVIASGEPDAAVKRALASTPRLTGSPLLKKVQEFKEFKTAARGFCNVAGLVKLLGKVDPQAPKVLDTLGLAGIPDVAFYCGFDGPALHNLIVADLPAPRKGLARLAGGKPFKLDELPPLPADLIGFTALRFDAGALFDGGVDLLEKLLPPNEAPAVKAGITGLNQALGIDIRKDLIGGLGSLVVSCAAPPDGGLIFGQTLLIQVKDEKQFARTLEQALKGLALISGGELGLKQRTYRDVTLNTLQVRQREFFLTPTYAVHKGWLVIGMTPQPVQSHILRGAGELPAWKPSADIAAALGKLPAEHNVVSISDPRPVMKLAISGAPLLGQGIMNYLPNQVDFPLLPSADEFVKHLFPNVAVASDDGKTWRMESRSSFDLPFGLVRADSGALTLSLLALLWEAAR
jgi:hypothetical protein